MSEPCLCHCHDELDNVDEGVDMRARKSKSDGTSASMRDVELARQLCPLDRTHPEGHTKTAALLIPFFFLTRFRWFSVGFPLVFPLSGSDCMSDRVEAHHDASIVYVSLGFQLFSENVYERSTLCFAQCRTAVTILTINSSSSSSLSKCCECCTFLGWEERNIVSRSRQGVNEEVPTVGTRGSQSSCIGSLFLFRFSLDFLLFFSCERSTLTLMLLIVVGKYNNK